MKWTSEPETKSRYLLSLLVSRSSFYLPVHSQLNFSALNEPCYRVVNGGNRQGVVVEFPHPTHTDNITSNNINPIIVLIRHFISYPLWFFVYPASNVHYPQALALSNCSHEPGITHRKKQVSNATGRGNREEYFKSFTGYLLQPVPLIGNENTDACKTE